MTKHKRPDRSTPRAALVKWIDANSVGPGWEEIGTLPPLEPVHCVSVGFVLEEEGDTVVLAQTVGDTAVCSRICIPRGCIKSMKTLNF